MALVASVGVRSAGIWILDVLGIELSSSWLLQVSGDLLAAVLIAIVITVFYWFSWNRPNRRWRTVLTAAILAAICLGLLGNFAYLVVGRTLTNPVYGALAVAAALLLFLYFVAAIHLYFACWLAVMEGAREPSEQQAFAARTRGGGVELPSAELPTAAEGRRDAADGDG
jgi:membrane protein